MNDVFLVCHERRSVATERHELCVFQLFIDAMDLDTALFIDEVIFGNVVVLVDVVPVCRIGSRGLDTVEDAAQLAVPFLIRRIAIEQAVDDIVQIAVFILCRADHPLARLDDWCIILVVERKSDRLDGCFMLRLGRGFLPTVVNDLVVTLLVDQRADVRDILLRAWLHGAQILAILEFDGIDADRAAGTEVATCKPCDGESFALVFLIAAIRAGIHASRLADGDVFRDFLFHHDCLPCELSVL